MNGSIRSVFLLRNKQALIINKINQLIIIIKLILKIIKPEKSNNNDAEELI